MGKIEPNQSPRPVSLLLWTPVPASPSASFLNTSVPLSFSKAQSGKQRVLPVYGPSKERVPLRLSWERRVS